MNFDFTPLIWMGVAIGIIIAIAGYGLIQGLCWLIFHLQWI